MDDSKPIALWARIAAGLIVGLIATELVGTAWSYWQHRVSPDSPWYPWFILGYSAWTVGPAFWSAAFKGRVSHDDTILTRPKTARYEKYLKYKNYADYACTAALFILGCYYQPTATLLFVMFLACLMIWTGLQVYFMPLKTKLAYLAKAKARHGIPADQPHPKDKILKSGFYRIP